MAKITNKQYADIWAEFRENIDKATPVDLSEKQADKLKRIAQLEKEPEQWFKYYFPNFYTSEPAPFHIKATKRILANPEWFEVRAWSRELSKSGRTMMEVLYLALTKQVRNIIMVSATESDAQRLLLPYKSILEKNNRIINDYGVQESRSKWEAGEFTTKKGVAFRAIGAGQSPRGTRNDEKRPDVILLDDIDTDVEVRNPERITNKVNWVMEALYGTRSISNPLRFIVCGNIIGKRTTVTELGKKADVFEVINIRDKNGKSTWPAKNTEELIDRTLSKISYRSAQKEYFNNPMKEGTVFKELKYGKAPNLSSCEKVVVYADPSTSNKDAANASKGTSHKSVVIIGYKNLQFFVYWVRVEQTNTSRFIDWLFDADKYLRDHHVDVRRIWIENNSLQDNFFEQVLHPEIRKRARLKRHNLPVSKDTRNKPDKFYRIEGTLEPIHRNGDLIWDEKLKDTPDMERMEDQMLDVSPSSKTMDGPDAVEGAVHKLQENTGSIHNEYIVGQRTSFK
jgi:hypothetical protein